jgi:hypothetical protein
VEVDLCLGGTLTAHHERISTMDQRPTTVYCQFDIIPNNFRYIQGRELNLHDTHLHVSSAIPLHPIVLPGNQPPQAWL